MNKDKWLHGLALALSIGLLIWAGHSFARMMWSLLASPVTSAPTASWSSPQPVSSVRVSVEDLTQLESAYVLSRGDAARRSPSSPQSAAETRLSVTLHGTVVATDPAFSHAIMSARPPVRNSVAAATEGGNARLQGVYRAGDVLEEVGRAVTLRSIHADYVMLDNNGREEVLWLFGQRSDDVAATSAAAIPPATVASAEPLVSDPQALARFSDILRLQFVQNEGAIGGLRIRYGSRQDLLTPIGIRIGDTITAVNGQPIDGPESLMQLSQQLQQGAAVRLTLDQQGEQHDVELAPHMLSHR